MKSIESQPILDDEPEQDPHFAKMNNWWKDAVVAPPYREVWVLLIHWKKELDNLECADEVQNLSKLFRETYLYSSEIFELDNKTNCELQLLNCIGGFVQKHDKPGSLIIVYYSGHGSYLENQEQLILRAKPIDTYSVLQTGSGYETEATWENAEKILMENTKCDTLSILDCCYAGNVHKGGNARSTRTYQLISATGQGEITQRPGPTSFTQALMDSLLYKYNNNQGRPFTTRELVEHIKTQTTRKKYPPQLAYRLYRYDREILLGPLPAILENHRRRVLPSSAFLTLRLSFSDGEELKEDQVKDLGKRMMQASKDSGLPIHHLDLVKYTKSTRKRTLFQLGSHIIAATRFQNSSKHKHSILQDEVLQKDFLIMPCSETENPMSYQRSSTQSLIDTAESLQYSSGQPSKKRRRTSTPGDEEASSPTRLKLNPET